MDGGVSTAPLSYKPWMHAAIAATLANVHSRNVVRVVAATRRSAARARHVIHLDIEPEPDCLIETQPASSSTFFEQ